MDWEIYDNRILLYEALLDKLRELFFLDEVMSVRDKGKVPKSWILFLKENKVAAWGFESTFGPEDLHYEFRDYVWVHSPEGEVADGLGEDWKYREHRSFLMIPQNLAEKILTGKVFPVGYQEHETLPRNELPAPVPNP